MLKLSDENGNRSNQALLFLCQNHWKKQDLQRFMEQLNKPTKSKKDCLHILLK